MNAAKDAGSPEPSPPMPPGAPPPPAAPPSAGTDTGAGGGAESRSRRDRRRQPAGSAATATDATRTRGGSTMTSARPADPYGQGSGYPRQEADQYRPPEAYPTPQPSSTPPQAVRRPRTDAKTVPRIRKARLRVSKADPWSVMKVSFLLSIALGICLVIAVALLWMVMDAMGVFATVGETINEATETDADSGFDLEAFLSLQRVLMFTALIAVIDVILATALATLGAFVYNISAGFVGGIEVTLAEDE